jgi:ParB family chromosome partitioning protein
MGRYMIVFGHRRVRAAKLLNRKVRAVVKEMKDQEHVLAQGQENSARANLSFIEKALFAAKLCRLHYDEDNSTVLAALAIDRTTLSKMLSVTSLPAEILETIGPAKGVGHDRWYELKLLLEKPATLDFALKAIKEDGIGGLSSDERFNAIMARLKAAKSTSRPRSGPKQNWASEDGLLSAEMTAEGKRYTMSLKAKGPDAKAFGEYLSERLAHLYQAFRQEKDHN